MRSWCSSLHLRHLSLLLLLWEMGRSGVVCFSPSLYHSARFKPCDLHGCRHHLLSVLAYSSWLDLGLFFSWDCGQRVVNPSPSLASSRSGFAGQSPSFPSSPAPLLKHRAVLRDPFSSASVWAFLDSALCLSPPFFWVCCDSFYFNFISRSCHFKREKEKVLKLQT